MPKHLKISAEDGPAAILPPEALPLLESLAPAFTRSTLRRFVVLLAASILTQGLNTVADLLRSLGGLAQGHRTDFQRVLPALPGRA